MRSRKNKQNAANGAPNTKPAGPGGPAMSQYGNGSTGYASTGGANYANVAPEQPNYAGTSPNAGTSHSPSWGHAGLAAGGAAAGGLAAGAAASHYSHEHNGQQDPNQGYYAADGKPLGATQPYNGAPYGGNNTYDYKYAGGSPPPAANTFELDSGQQNIPSRGASPAVSSVNPSTAASPVPQAAELHSNNLAPPQVHEAPSDATATTTQAPSTIQSEGQQSENYPAGSHQSGPIPTELPTTN